MIFETDLSNGILRVSPMGELDVRSAPETRHYLDKLIDKGNFRELILDFRKVDFMDSTGIGVLLGRYKLLQKRGIPLSVSHLNDQIDKVFRVSGLYQIIKAVEK